MDLKDDVIAVKEEIKEAKKQIKQNSFAMELLRDEKERNQHLVSFTKRMFIIWVVTFISFLGLMAYTIYLLNDIETVETTEQYSQDINDIGDISESNIVNGGDINGKD